MKRQILNLEGVAVLTKEQQKAVNGGISSSTCTCNTSAGCTGKGQRCVNGCGAYDDGHVSNGYHGICEGGYQDLTPVFGFQS